jgi:hypothetical protein
MKSQSPELSSPVSYYWPDKSSPASQFDDFANNDEANLRGHSIY